MSRKRRFTKTFQAQEANPSNTGLRRSRKLFLNGILDELQKKQ